MKDTVVATIVNWERPKDTLACIDSLRRTNGIRPSVIVVDNGSKDGSIDILRSAEPQADIVSLRENLGFSAGYNIGVQKALETGASHILVLNNDTLLEPNTVSELLSCSPAIAVPKILHYPQTDRIWSAGCRWRVFPPGVIMRGFGKRDIGQYDDPIDLEFATACALLVHRDVFRVIGGFDEDYISYLEDYDFCFRAREAGFSIRYVPSAKVFHKVALSLSQNPDKRWWYLGRNAVLFFRKTDRYSRSALAAHVLWTTLREILKGRLKGAVAYLGGVTSGLGVVRPEP